MLVFLRVENGGSGMRFKQAKTSHVCSQVMTKAWEVINLQTYCTQIHCMVSGGETNTPCTCWEGLYSRLLSSWVNPFMLSTAVEECCSKRVKFTLTHKHEDNRSTFSLKDFVLFTLTWYSGRSEWMSTIQQIFNPQRAMCSLTHEYYLGIMWDSSCVLRWTGKKW